MQTRRTILDSALMIRGSDSAHKQLAVICGQSDAHKSNQIGFDYFFLKESL